MRRLLIALLMLAAGAAPVEAATVTTNLGQILLAESGDEPNSVQVAVASDGRILLTDPAGIVASGECEPAGDTAARCPAPPGGIELMLDAGPNLVEVDVALTLPVTVFGGPGADVFAGGGGADRLYGGPGVDRLSGGGGADLLRGHDGDDLLLGGEGDDTLLGEAGFDDLDGGLGRDTIDGGYDRDRLAHAGRSAGVRVSLLRGEGELADTEDAVASIETVEGTPHADVIQGGDGDEQIDGSAGGDRISGGPGADMLLGGDGDDLLLGDSGGLDAPSTSVGGRGGEDTVHGGPGADALRGDAGRDLLDGEDGDDVVDAREAEATQEVRHELVQCGAGADRALFDWNDQGVDCEDVSAAARPGPPPVTIVAPVPRPGPGPQPVLGRPVVEGRMLRVPVFCSRSSGCAARVRVREVHRIRVRGRRRTRAGRVLVSGRHRIPAGATTVVTLRLPARGRRGVVELSIGGERWARPLPPSARAVGS